MKSISQRALIFGATGQDGALLARHLLGRGYEVYGTSRSKIAAGGNLDALGIFDRVRVHTINPSDHVQVAELLGALRPNEIYSLSGQSSVGLSFKQPRETFDSHVDSTLAVLEAIRTTSLDCRLFNASSGEIFGDTGQSPADESSPMAPASPYGAAKAAATLLVESYRKSFGLFACSGILFNHESPLRAETFVTQRIAKGAAAIKMGRADRLTLGNLKVVRDWGWAAEYVQCISAMLDQPEPRDLVIATGRASSLEDFIAQVFGRFDLDWKDWVVSDKGLFRSNDIPTSIGDPRAAERHLGWRASVFMPEVAQRLADAALERASA